VKPGDETIDGYVACAAAGSLARRVFCAVGR
jgi:hypothetical protein